MFFRENRDKDGGFYDAGLWVERFGGEMQMPDADAEPVYLPFPYKGTS